MATPSTRVDFPEPDAIVRGLNDGFAATIHAFGDFFGNLIASGLWSVLVLFTIFALVQGVSTDAYNFLKRVLSRLWQLVLRILRASILAQFASGSTRIIVTEYSSRELNKDLSMKMALLRINKWISRGSYHSLLQVTQYLASRGQKKLQVIGDKEDHNTGDLPSWNFGGPEKTIILGSQITNRAAKLLARLWNEKHPTQIEFDDNADDGAVGVALRDSAGNLLCSVRTTIQEDGSGEDGAIVIYSKRAITASKPVLQISGCSALGTQAIVDCLVKRDPQARALSRKAFGRSDFVAFFELKLDHEGIVAIRLLDVFGARDTYHPRPTRRDDSKTIANATS